MNQFNRFKKTIGTILFASFFFVVAGFFNASMDITKQSFNDSIYSKISNDKSSDIYIYFLSHWTNKWDYSLTEKSDYPVRIYNGQLAWVKLDENGNRIPKWFLGIKIFPFNHPLFFDSWHMFKSVMFGSFIIMMIILYFKPNRIIFHWKYFSHWVVVVIVFIWFSLVWNLSFNLFYDNLLRL